MKALIVAVMLVMQSAAVAGQSMNQESVEVIIKSMARDVVGEKGQLEFVFNNVKMYLISDVTYDRMRIISPIENYSTVSKYQLDAMMEANFHNALDARYAVSNGVIYSAYVHPLSTLNEDDLRSAVIQVSNLALTFGSEYSSGVLSFGSEEPGSGGI